MPVAASKSLASCASTSSSSGDELNRPLIVAPFSAAGAAPAAAFAVGATCAAEAAVGWAGAAVGAAGAEVGVVGEAEHAATSVATPPTVNEASTPDKNRRRVMSTGRS